MSDDNSREFGEEGLSEDETESKSESESEEGDEFSSENEFGVEEECLPVDSERGTTSLSSNKRTIEMSIDRLSALPDSLLIHILSFLQIHNAASTCVLSKRWQFLWTEIPRLEYYTPCRCSDEETRNDEQTRIFGSMVHGVLANHSVNNLQKFWVSLYFDESLASYIDVWFDFVGKKMVKDVGLFLSYNRDEYMLPEMMYYMLPQMMYSNSLLTSLTLEACTFYPKGTIMWSSLTTLYLDDMEILECVIKKILVGCPALVSLSLMKCWGFNCLEIHSHSVRTLRIEDWDYDFDDLVEISAPDVHFLDILLHLEGKKFRLRNISSVLTAKFDFTGYIWNLEFVGLMSYTKDLFVSLQHIKKLDLGFGAIKVLALLAANGCQFPQSRQLECLIIKAQKNEESISGILILLESSPSLETLVINGMICLRAFMSANPSPVAIRDDLDCDLLHLKTVNITNFDFKLDGVILLKLAQILLKRARVLEKMVIEGYQISSKKSSHNLNKLALTLLSYPRSSEKAVVLLRDDSHTTM